MPRKINKRKKIQVIKRKAGLAPPPRKSIYDRPSDTEGYGYPRRPLRGLLTVEMDYERIW